MPQNNDKELKCVQLKSGDKIGRKQYADIAKLIYETDPYIYPALFGEGAEGVKNAAAILPEVFESGKDAMFSKQNLFVLLQGKNVAGLILWNRGPLNWDPEQFLRIAAENGVSLIKEDVYKVSLEYVDNCYSEGELRDCTVLSLINICVKRRKRGAGLGSIMLGAFINEHISEDMELVVLADNKAAVRLYEKFGFVTVSTRAGFPLDGARPLCCTMERKSDS